MWWKRIVVPTFLTALAVGFGLIAGCESAPDPWPAKTGPRVLASFVPLYCFALNVAGDDATVLPLMSGKGPHDYAGTPRDAAKLRRADLFLINGLGLDDRVAGKLKRNAGNSLLKLVELGESVPEDRRREGACTCNHSHDAHEDHHSHGYDPHVWLGLPEAVLMVEKLRDVLIEADPEHTAGYTERAAAYIGKLKSLHSEGQSLLRDKTERRIVSFHDSLFYFTRAFDLEVAAAIEQQAGLEPGGKRLTELIQTCQKDQVRVIAVEPQYPSNTSAKAVLDELRRKGVAAEFVEIDPLETADVLELGPDYYEKVMRTNLNNLARVLK